MTKSNSSLPFAAGKRYYFGDFERNINTENNVVTDLDYIFANGRLVALIKTVGSTKTSYGVLTDRQGSLRALYNGSGLVQSFSYDAWGNRRNPSTGAALTTSELVAANSITARGYTCHEHMDEFGLINMNARIYDPALGMFISVDPLAQEYYNTYPYAYCGGDPVNAVDPTGKSTWWTTDDPEQIEAYWAWFSQIGGGNTGSYNFGNANWGSSSFTFEEYQEAIQEGKGITHLIHDRELGHIPMMDPEPEGKLGKAVAVAVTLSVSDGPIPAGELVGISVIAGAAIHDITQKVYVTYTLTRPDGKIYIGRSSGYGDPYSIVLRRFYSHHRRAEGYDNPQLDRYAKGPSGYVAIRGREQQLIDYYGGIGSPNVGNIIRGVSRYNPRGYIFHKTSNAYFGNIAPYTGFKIIR